MNNLHSAVATILRDVARDIVLPRYQALSAADILEKTPGELVTVADREAEAAITDRLGALDPGATIIGEELVSARPDALDLLGAPRLWIIDPIDGTANFAAGRSPFGIMVALAQHGEVEASWILDPVSDRLCHAARGVGAFVDGKPVRAGALAARAPVAALALQFLPAEQRTRVELAAARHFDLVAIPKCAAEQYPRLCLGQNDIGFFQRSLPWDHAAGALLLNEAGGRVARFDGAPYRLDDGRRGLIAASSPDLWELARTVLMAPELAIDENAPLVIAQ